MQLDGQTICITWLKRQKEEILKPKGDEAASKRPRRPASYDFFLSVRTDVRTLGADKNLDITIRPA